MAYVNIKPTDRKAIAFLLHDLADQHERQANDTSSKPSERVMARLSADDLRTLADQVETAKTMRVYT